MEGEIKQTQTKGIYDHYTRVTEDPQRNPIYDRENIEHP